MKTDLVDAKKVEELLAKIKASEVKNKFDLSSGEDLSLAVMNLISIEEHLFFTAAKLGKMSYLPVLNEVRQMRKELMKEMIKDYEGEVWCLSKHLLAATMRLSEVGTKSLGKGKKEEAWDFFQKAYQLYSLFWGLNLGAVKSKTLKGELKDFGFEKKEFLAEEEVVAKKGNRFFAKLGELVKKAVDCCIE